MKLLYYSPSSYGGLADYAHEQANSLVDIGVEVIFLCTPNYPTGRQEKYKIVSILKEQKAQNQGNKIFKIIDFIDTTLTNFRRLSNFIVKNNIKYVLLGSYVEYLAPFWSISLQHLANRGVVFGAVIHDPVRDFILGPEWWHRWSIACAYSFLREAFVHEAIELNTEKPMPQLRTTVIPHGSYQFATPRHSRAEVRNRLNIPLDSKVLLSFGHIRDGKNLDLALQAIAYFPDLYLIVAGKVISSTQKPVTYYQELAKKLNMMERCRWLIEFIPEEQVGELFQASDAVLLTYDKHFQSASGVLNAGVAYQKPCIASAGRGNLRSVVTKYKLGIFVEPDDDQEIFNGIQQWLNGIEEPQFDRYEKDNSWKNNANLIYEQFWRSTD